MKINWKVRFRNPQFIIQLLLAIGAPILAYMGLSASDITTWGVLFQTVGYALSNPFVLGLVFVSVYNAVNDPTTDGFSDSRQALKYTEPKKDVK